MRNVKITHRNYDRRKRAPPAGAAMEAFKRGSEVTLLQNNKSRVELVGLGGWVNKTSGFNTGGSCLFFVSNLELSAALGHDKRRELQNKQSFIHINVNRIHLLNV